MDNTNIKIWTPESTRVAKLRRLVRNTLEKYGNHLVTTVDNKTNGTARVIELEAKTVEIAEKLHNESIRNKEASSRTGMGRWKDQTQKIL